MRTINILGFKIDIGKHYPRPTIREAMKLGDNLIGVEIGTDEGINAREILETGKIKMLYLIDPYMPYNEPSFNKNNYEPTKQLYKAELLLKKFENKKFIIFESDEAKQFIPDNLDFVYIDGNHNYEFVKQDILNYLPKVKKGGVIGGHNIDRVGVIKAILEIFPNNKINLLENDWWIIV